MKIKVIIVHYYHDTNGRFFHIAMYIIYMSVLHVILTYCNKHINEIARHNQTTCLFRMIMVENKTDTAPTSGPLFAKR